MAVEGVGDTGDVPPDAKAILAGRADSALVLDRLEQPLPASWEEQRRYINLAPTSQS